MNICLENVNLKSSNGPNSFGKKLVKYLSSTEHNITTYENSDVRLCFIETYRPKCNTPLFQRLDGIYFNIKQNYNLQNANIKKTYEMSDGIIFQSEFNRNLITKWFGSHHNTIIIHNGADFDKINSIKPLENSILDKYEKTWMCASQWRPHKRLSENIRYFLEHSSEKGCLVVAGKTDSKPYKDERILYAGELSIDQLISLYKRSAYFVHLAWLDHCPNVVVDARAADCQIICSSAGGTAEVSGLDAIIIQEDKWDYEPIDLYNPPRLDFTRKNKNIWNTELNMEKVAEKYVKMLLNKVYK